MQWSFCDMLIVEAQIRVPAIKVYEPSLEGNVREHQTSRRVQVVSERVVGVPRTG